MRTGKRHFSVAHARRGLRVHRALLGHPGPEPGVTAGVGIVQIRPATTAMGGAPDAVAPSWAAPSIPSARPETTLTPTAARSAPNCAATPMP